LTKILRRIFEILRGKRFEEMIKSCGIQNCDSVLDVGCGSNSPLKLLGKSIFLVGVDGYKPSLLKSKKSGFHYDYVLADLENLPFKPKAFCGVASLDVIEHFSYIQGKKLLKDIESLAFGLVVVFTPNGFLNQQEFDGNTLQIHKSGWGVSDFKNMGFEVKGAFGFKPLRGELGHLKFKPFWLFNLLSDLSQRFTFSFPSVAFEILCVKKMGRYVQ
jgi:SAM-dependent methyltransferase